MPVPMMNAPASPESGPPSEHEDMAMQHETVAEVSAIEVLDSEPELVCGF